MGAIGLRNEVMLRWIIKTKSVESVCGVPQYLKDRVVEESRRLNIGQSDLVRMVLSLYFENKDGETNG